MKIGALSADGKKPAPGLATSKVAQFLLQIVIQTSLRMIDSNQPTSVWTEYLTW